MAVKNYEYSKKFTTVTDYHDVSRHGSPEMKPHQENSPGDIEMREQIIEKFGHFKLEGRFNSGNYFGSDGTVNYTFNFSVRFLENDKNPKKNISYETYINLKKSGDEQRLDELSDIERFVLEKGFEKTD